MIYYNSAIKDYRAESNYRILPYYIAKKGGVLPMGKIILALLSFATIVIEEIFKDGD